MTRDNKHSRAAAVAKAITNTPGNLKVPPLNERGTFGPSSHPRGDLTEVVWVVDRVTKTDRHGYQSRTHNCDVEGCTPVEAPWARWPWQACVAVTIDTYGRCRCDLKRDHIGPHRAERGTYDVVWQQNTWFETGVRPGAALPESDSRNGSPAAHGCPGTVHGVCPNYEAGGDWCPEGYCEELGAWP